MSGPRQWQDLLAKEEAFRREPPPDRSVRSTIAVAVKAKDRRRGSQQPDDPEA
jgi:hypothetical protein